MSPPLLKLSLNEVSFYFTRAAVGAGVPFGLAEDFGHWASWLSCSGMDPAEICTTALKSLDSGESGLSVNLSKRRGRTLLKSTSGQKLSAIQAGSFACDWIKTTDLTSLRHCRLSVENVDSPFLVAAAVGASGFGGWSVYWKLSSEIYYLVNQKVAGNWEVFWNRGSAPGISGPADLSIMPANDEELALVFQYHRKYNFQDERLYVLENGVAIYDSWPFIYRFFRRCLVPSTNESRHVGAGAGLVDTD